MTNKLKHQLTSKHAWLMYLAKLKRTIRIYFLLHDWIDNDWDRIEHMYRTIYHDKQHNFNSDKCYDELYAIECKYKELMKNIKEKTE